MLIQHIHPFKIVDFSDAFNILSLGILQCWEFLWPSLRDSLNFAFWRGINSECSFWGPFLSHSKTHSWVTSGSSLRPFSVVLVGSLWVKSSTLHCYVYFSNFTQFMGSSFQMNLPKILTSSCHFSGLRNCNVSKIKSQPQLGIQGLQVSPPTYKEIR